MFMIGVWLKAAPWPATARAISKSAGSRQYVKSLLNGTLPRELRVETMEDVELAINLRTAQELGLKIPTNMLARAGKIIR
jgi:ABC-type uncharacterized transport system substrate-binding protein